MGNTGREIDVCALIWFPTWLQRCKMLLQGSSGHGAKSHGANDTFGIDEEGGGGGSDVIEGHDLLVIVEQDGVGQVMLLHKPGRRRAIVHAVYAQDDNMFAAGTLLRVEQL